MLLSPLLFARRLSLFRQPETVFASRARPDVCVRAPYTQANTMGFDGPAFDGQQTTGRVVMEGAGDDRSLSARGQGQLILLTAFAATAIPADDPAAPDMWRYAFELFIGWRHLCVLSANQQQTCQVVSEDSLVSREFSCRDDFLEAGASAHRRLPCFPHSKFDDSMELVRQSGSETAADLDAILGMIVLAVNFEGSGMAWWKHWLGRWAYDSCKAFLHFNTESNADGSERIVRSTSCGRGWGCSSPSTHSPAHFRVFRRYMRDYHDEFGGGVKRNKDKEEFSAMWDTLIKTSYRVLEASQCPTTGLMSNWFVPSVESGVSEQQRGTERCSVQLYPDQFGNEAAAVAWRLFLDYVWFTGRPDWHDSSHHGRQPQTILRRMASHMVKKLKNADDKLDVGCTAPGGNRIDSVRPGWIQKPAMTTHILAALLVPPPADAPAMAIDEQQGVLDYLARILVSSAAKTSSYRLLASFLFAKDPFSVATAVHSRRSDLKLPPSPPRPPPYPPSPPAPPFPPPPPKPFPPNPPNPPPAPPASPAPPAPARCPMDVYARLESNEGREFTIRVDVERWMAGVVLFVDFGNDVISHVSHSLGARMLSGEGKSILKFSVIEGRPARFTFSGRMPYDIDARPGGASAFKLPTLSCTGDFPPSAPPPPSPFPPPPSPPPLPPRPPPPPPSDPAPPNPPPLPSSPPSPMPPPPSAPPPLSPPPFPPPAPPGPPPEFCALEPTVTAKVANHGQARVRVQLSKWLEGAQIRVYFDKAFKGAIDQGKHATLLGGGPSFEPVFELWETPATEPYYFDFAIFQDDDEAHAFAAPRIACPAWRPSPPPPHPPPSPMPAPPPPPSPPPPPNPKSDKDCTMLRKELADEGSWKVHIDGEGRHVCSQSVGPDGKECSGQVPLELAAKFCNDMGARLCTADQLDANVAEDSGCDYDGERVWSSTICRDDEGHVGHWTLAGSRVYRKHVAKECTPATTNHVARCCADLVYYPPSPPLALQEPPSELRSVGSTCSSLQVRWMNDEDRIGQFGGSWPATGFQVEWADAFAASSQADGGGGGGATSAVNRCAAGTERSADGITCTRRADEGYAWLGDLKAGTEYTVRVRTINAAGLGEPSEPFVFSTLMPDQAPEAPEPVKRHETPECSTIEMRAPSLRASGCSSDNHLAIQSFTTHRRDWTAVLNVQDTEVRLENLDPMIAYSFRVVAVNQAGSSEPSAEAGPFVPGNLEKLLRTGAPNVTNTSSGSYLVEWAHLQDRCQTGASWRLVYRRNGGAAEMWTLLPETFGGTSARPRVTCPEGCAFRARPVIAGWEGWSLPSTPVPTPRLPPLPARALRLGMGLKASPAEYPMGHHQVYAFEHGVAAALVVPRTRVHVVEKQQLDSSWTIIFDLLPDPSTEGAVEGEPVLELGKSLAAKLDDSDTVLASGEMSRFADRPAGLLVLLPEKSLGGFGEYTLTRTGIRTESFVDKALEVIESLESIDMNITNRGAFGIGLMALSICLALIHVCLRCRTRSADYVKVSSHKEYAVEAESMERLTDDDFNEDEADYF